MTNKEYHDKAKAIYKDILFYVIRDNQREKLIEAASKSPRDFSALQVRDSKKPHFDFGNWTTEELGLYSCIIIDKYYVEKGNLQLQLAAKSRLSILERE